MDVRPVLSTTVIIASGAEPNSTGPSKNATRLPSGETRSDHAARASWTVVPAGNSTVQGRPFRGIADDGERIGSGNPIGVHDAGEHVAACTTSHRDARQRAQAERPLDVLRAEQHGHVARSRNRQDPRVFQLEVARIAAPRTAEKCGVGLALPARAVDEALTIGV